MIPKLLAAFLVAAGIVAAQTSGSSPGVPVNLVVSVEPRKGKEMPVVQREDVMVFQGKERRKVTAWVPFQGDHAALELYILIDDGLDTSLGTQLDDIRKFILAQPETTQIGVAYMQNGAARIVQSLSADHEAA